MKQLSQLRLFIFAGLVCSSIHSLDAAPTTFTFSGVVTVVSPGLTSEFTVSDTFHGRYTFESTTPPAIPAEALNFWDLLESAFAISFRGGYTASEIPSPSYSAFDRPQISIKDFPAEDR